MSVLISCETGGRRVPAWLVGEGKRKIAKSTANTAPLQMLTAGHLPLRMSGDTSASHIARRMAKRLEAVLVQNDVSHRLIDVTRSLQHRRPFGIGTRSWPPEFKQRLIDEVYLPYRESLRATIAQMLRAHGEVIHLSIRTFEAKSKGKPRRTDIGLLYDPSIAVEVEFCLDWIDQMYDDAPMLKVRRNYPRRGTTESVTKAMRTMFGSDNYLGVEVLCNRAWAGREVKARDEAIDRMCKSLIQITPLVQAEAA